MTLGEDYDDEITAFYRKHVGRVRGFLINLGTDPGLADEIADDAFLGARRHWKKVRCFDQPEGYVFKIARNERSRRQVKLDGKARDLCPDPSAQRQQSQHGLAEEVADRAVVREALQQLPLRQREAVTLRDVEGFSVDATAEIMGITEGAVKRYTFQGRQTLRLLLAEFRHQRGGNDR